MVTAKSRSRKKHHGSFDSQDDGHPLPLLPPAGPIHTSPLPPLPYSPDDHRAVLRIKHTHFASNTPVHHHQTSDTSDRESPSRTAAVWSGTPPMSKVKSPQLYSKDKTPQLSSVSTANGTSSATPSSIQPEVGVDERRSESCSSSPAQSRQKKKRGLERNDSYHSDGPSAEGRKVNQIIRYNIMFQCSMSQA